MDTLTTNNSLIEESENLKRILDERLEMHDNSRKAVQDKLHEICEGLRNQIDEFENKINSELEDNFDKEDSRLQNALSDLHDIDMDELNDDELRQAIQKVKTELLVIQSYELIPSEHKRQENYISINSGNDDDDSYDDEGYDEKPVMKEVKTESESMLILTDKWELKVIKKIIPEILSLKKPKDIRITDNTNDKISIQFTHLSSDEKRVLSQHNLMNQIKYKCLLSKKENDEQDYKEYTLNETGDYFTFMPDFLEAETTYEIRVKAMLYGKESEWSDETAEFTTPGFKEHCVWKECPGDVERCHKYSTDENNSRIATNITDDSYCTIIGNTPLSLNRVTSWNIKILK